MNKPMFTKSFTISIHALREEGDFSPINSFQCSHNFYPRPPRGGRPRICARNDKSNRNFYPRPPRGGRLADVVKQRVDFLISIHALREEGDPSTSCVRRFRFNFYPRPPRGGRQTTASRTTKPKEFLSTPSARRATQRFVYNARHEMDFYPRPPRGGRRVSRTRWRLRCHFYPRPPRGGRPSKTRQCPTTQRFLSTPSARRATLPALHHIRCPGYFYPRPPRGGRRSSDINLPSGIAYFYPRPPRGGRPSMPRPFGPSRYFYPRPPRGGRQSSLSNINVPI